MNVFGTHESTWFSKDRRMGNGDVLNAHSAIASITSCKKKQRYIQDAGTRHGYSFFLWTTCINMPVFFTHGTQWREMVRKVCEGCWPIKVLLVALQDKKKEGCMLAV